MATYGRHAFICMNGNCADPEQAMALQRRFLELNRQNELNKLRNPERVKCTLSDCLGICSNGPILTVYPDGIWYRKRRWLGRLRRPFADGDDRRQLEDRY